MAAIPFSAFRQYTQAKSGVFLGGRIMAITIEAIYENGVLKPVQPLPFREHQKVEVTVSSASNWVQETAGILKWTGSPEELQRFAEDSELDYPPPPEGS